MVPTRHGLLFVWGDGRHLNPDRVWHEFVRLLDEAGLLRVRCHDPRQTHATLLLRAGVNPRVVSELLGHSWVAFTLDTYAHMLPGRQPPPTASPGCCRGSADGR